MTYSKQTWVDDTTPLSAARMNNMESGIAAAATGLLNVTQIPNGTNAGTSGAVVYAATTPAITFPGSRAVRFRVDSFYYTPGPSGAPTSPPSLSNWIERFDSAGSVRQGAFGFIPFKMINDTTDIIYECVVNIPAGTWVFKLASSQGSTTTCYTVAGLANWTAASNAGANAVSEFKIYDEGAWPS